MGIFSGLFKSRDKPTNSINGSGYRFFFGGTTSGKSINERSALQMMHTIQPGYFQHYRETMDN